MRKILMATTVVVAASALFAEPAFAQHRGGGGFLSGFAGGVLGGAIAGALTQPPPPTVYYAPPVVLTPPVIYQSRPYVPAAPAQHIAFHPWPGPGFACYEPEPNSVNRAICASEDLSAASLAVQQAAYAAMQQTPYNAGALRTEYAGFLQTTRSSCGQYSFQQQSDCVSGLLAQERNNFTNRLSGVFSDEAARPVAVHVAVQQRLQAMGLLSGAPDGIYGDGTRRAISKWQSAQGRSATGVLTNDEVALLVPGLASPIPPAAAAPTLLTSVPPPSAPPPSSVVPAVVAAPVPAAPAPATAIQTVAISQTEAVPVSATPAAAPTDILGGLRENMPYALARPKLFAAGWQTQFFKTSSLTDQERDTRQWFIDHRVMEVEDCSSSGCKMQLHNADGRLLYVYTQIGSRASDAYRGAGPAVIAYCLDVDDITCPAPEPVKAAASKTAAR